VTDQVSKLAADAAAAFGEACVGVDDRTVRLAFEDVAVSLAVREEETRQIVCRSFVAGVTRVDDPAAFCREALEANFFWRGTNGATLSMDARATALYLTEFVAAADIDGPEALAAHLEGFVDTVVDWRLRVRSRQGGVDGLPQSADFSVPADELSEDGAEIGSRPPADDLTGLEVFR